MFPGCDRRLPTCIDEIELVTRMRRLAALVLAVLVLAGCSSLDSLVKDDRVDLSQAEVLGSWREAATGGIVSFADDGSFTATDLPHQMFDDFSGVLPAGYQAGRDKLPGSGRWELQAPSVDPGGPKNHLYLHVRRLSDHEVATGGDLRAENGENGVVLAFYIGDPDANQKIIYTRCPDSPSVTPTPGR